MQQPPSQHFKNLDSQNFIELKFNQKNAKDLSQEEALYRYKRNAYILGRIFSFTPDDSKKQEVQKNEFENQITEELVQQFQEKYEQLQQNHQAQLQEFKDSVQVFKALINRCRHLQGEEIPDMLQELKDLNYYADDHPFLREESQFYMNTDESTRIKEVTNVPQNYQLFAENEETPTFTYI